MGNKTRLHGKRQLTTKIVIKSMFGSKKKKKNDCQLRKLSNHRNWSWSNSIDFQRNFQHKKSASKKDIINGAVFGSA